MHYLCNVCRSFPEVNFTFSDRFPAGPPIFLVQRLSRTSSAQRHSPSCYLHKLQGKLYNAVTTCINTTTGCRAQHGPPPRGSASRATIERRHRRARRVAKLSPEVGSARPEVGGQSSGATMKPAVDEMFPEGAGPYVDLDEVGAEGVGG